MRQLIERQVNGMMNHAQTITHLETWSHRKTGTGKTELKQHETKGTFTRQ